MTPGLSKDIKCHGLAILFSMLTNHQIRRQATCKMESLSKPGDCKWPLLIFLTDLCGCVWIDILALSPLRVMFTDSD